MCILPPPVGQQNVGGVMDTSPKPVLPKIGAGLLDPQNGLPRIPVKVGK